MLTLLKMCLTLALAAVTKCWHMPALCLAAHAGSVTNSPMAQDPRGDGPRMGGCPTANYPNHGPGTA